jgi:RTX calcium-binding nonapeptide repeat (4 copies)
MSRIRLSLGNTKGQIELVRMHEIAAQSEPLRIALRSGQSVFIQIDGRQQTGEVPILGKRPLLRKVGSHLHIESDGILVVELQDFYTTEDVSLSGDGWLMTDGTDFEHKPFATTAPQGLEIAAVGVSGTGSGKELAAVGVSGTSRDLAAVGVSGTSQELAAVGVSGTGTGKDLAAVGVSGTSQDLAAVGVSGTSQELAAVGVSGTGAGKDLAAVGVSGTGTGTAPNTDLAAVGVSGTGRDLAAVGLSGTGRDLAAIGITGTGVNAWMAGVAILPFLENLGGTGTEPSATVLRGSVVAGPVTQGLEVEIFKLDNGVLVSMGSAVVQAGGSWTFVVQGYKGPLVAKVIDTNDAQGHDNTNYISELTGQEVDIQANLMTAFNAPTGVKSIQINALTTVAAMKAGLRVNAKGDFETPASGFGAATIENTNLAVAKACGLTDLVSGEVKAVIQLDKSKNLQANDYGKLIAAIEGAGGNDQAHLNKIAYGVSVSGHDAQLSDWYKKQLIAGASNVEINLKMAGVVTAVSDMLTRVSSSPEVQIAVIAGNDIVDDQERDGLGIVVAAPQDAASMQLWLDGVLMASLVSQRQGNTWTLSMPASAWTYGAHEVTVKAVAAGGNVLATSHRLFTVIDTTAPVISELVVSGIDGANSAKTTPLVAGDSIKVTLITSEPVQGWSAADKVVLMVGDVQREAHYVGSSGNEHSFAYAVVSGDLDATGGVSLLRLVSAQVRDEAGNALNAALPPRSNAVQVDAVAPLSPSLALAIDSGSSSTDGLSRFGTMNVSGLESGARWAYSTDGGNSWVTGVGSSFVLEPGHYATGTVRVRQTDVAGNLSAVGQTGGPITIDVQANVPTLALVTDTGFDNSDGITQSGMVKVSGLEAGAIWEYSTDGGNTWLPGANNSGAAQVNTDIHFVALPNVNDSFSLQSGTYAAGTIRVRQTDLAGNLSAEAANSGVIKIDTATSVTLAQGVPGTMVNAAEATDAAGVVNVRAEPGAIWTVTLTGPSGFVTKSGVGTGGSQAVVLQANDVSLLGQGVVTVIASVTDAAGNTAETSGVNFTMDTLVTRASVTALVDDVGPVMGLVNRGKKTDDAQLTVMGSVEQALGAGDVLKVYDGETPLEGPVTWTSATNWSFTDARALLDGHGVNYTARVQDAAGNEGTDGTTYSATIALPLGATLSVTANHVTSGVNGVASDHGIAADLFSGLSTVSGAAGNDSIQVASTLQVNGLTLRGEAGNDTIHFQGQLSGMGLIVGGLGNDSITFSGAHSGQSSIDGGDGNDTFNWTGANSGLITVVGGSGTDVLSIANAAAALGLEINGQAPGGGFNGRWLSGGNNSGSFTFEGMERFSLGGGNDTITIAVDVSNATVDGGSGNDRVDATLMSAGSISVVAGSGDDTVLLGGGNDTVNAATETVAANDSFSGGAGTDVLRYDALSNGLTFSITGASVGGGFGGTVTGTTGVGTDSFSGFERVVGSKGNDTFEVAAALGAVSIDGAQGNDVLSYASHTAGLTVTVTASSSGSVIKSALGSFATDSFLGIESIVAGGGDDRITVAASVSTGLYVEDGLGSDTISMGGGNDTVHATLETTFGNDSYLGGGGADLLSYAAQTAGLTFSITGGTPAGGWGGTVSAPNGMDVFSGFESIRGGMGNDHMVVSAGSGVNLWLADGAGNDTINATAVLSGSIVVSAGEGVDEVRLGAGNDTIAAQSGAENDLFDAGAGSDLLSYANQTDAMAANITGINSQGGADGLVLNLNGTATDSFFGFEHIRGGLGNDTFNVGANVNQVTLEGGAGNDVINATAMTAGGLRIVDGLGADTIVLGGGNDSVSITDAQNNSVTLGAGNDTLSLVASDQSVGNAGLGVQAMTDFNWLEDVMTLHQFWTAGTVRQNNLGEYLHMNGNTLQVDLDGLGNAFAMTNLVEFAAMSNFSSLSALFATDRLTITTDSVLPA